MVLYAVERFFTFGAVACTVHEPFLLTVTVTYPFFPVDTLHTSLPLVTFHVMGLPLLR